MVTGLDIKPTHTVFAPVAGQVVLLAHYFDGATDNEVEQALVAGLAEAGKTQDLFSPDGFNAALMIVHAVEASPDDVDGMIAALEGWTFDGPKGAMEIRAEDHALLQPMFQAKLVEADDADPGTGQGARRRSRHRRSRRSSERRRAPATVPPPARRPAARSCRAGRRPGPRRRLDDRRRRILDDITLDVAPGELLAVIGPNGAGKSTLVNMISGVARPSSGGILLDGKDVTRLPRAAAGTGRDRPDVPDVVAVQRADQPAERLLRAAVGRPRHR